MSDENAPHLNLAILLEIAYKKLDTRLVDELRGNGFPDIRPAHSQVFGAIAAEGSRVGDMAAQAGITQQSMSELVDSLVGLGYLERRPDPSDRRARLIALTERGWKAVHAGIAVVDGIERDWAAKVGARRMEQLRAALETIAFDDPA